MDDGVTEVSARCNKSPDLPQTTNDIFGQFRFNESLSSLPQNQLILHLSIGMPGPCSVLNRDTRGATAEMRVSSNTLFSFPNRQNISLMSPSPVQCNVESSAFRESFKRTSASNIEQR